MKTVQNTTKRKKSDEKIVVMNFANETYRKQQKDNTQSALKYGKADEVLEFSEKDLDEEYYTSNPEITKIKRGFGLWLWKPYLILKVMELMNDNEILVYSDGGLTFVRDVRKLIPFLNQSKDNVLLFELPLLNEDWTKREAFVYSGYEPEENERQLIGGFMILRVSQNSKEFIKEWYETCRDIRILSTEKFDKRIKEQPFFHTHRDDQSVLSIVAHKKNMDAYPDPTEWGEWPFKSSATGRCNFWKHKRPYPTIIICNRKADSKTYLKRYKRMHFLYSIGMYNAFTIRDKLKLLNLIFRR